MTEKSVTYEAVEHRYSAAVDAARRRLGDNLERSINDDKAVGTFSIARVAERSWTIVTCTGLRRSSVHTQLYRLLRITFDTSGDFRALEREGRRRCNMSVGLRLASETKRRRS